MKKTGITGLTHDDFLWCSSCGEYVYFQLGEWHRLGAAVGDDRCTHKSPPKHEG
jgi:hypothetical protein